MKALGILATAVALAGAAPVWAQEQSAPLPAVTVAKAKKHQVSDTVTYNGRLEADQSIDLIARVTGFLEEATFNPGDVVEKGALLFRIEPDQFRAAVRQAEGSLTAAEATVADARIERDRQTQLVQRNAAAQAVQDAAEAALGQAQGAVMQAEAALDAARLNLSYTSITAPFAGRVSARNVDPGALVGPEVGPLVTLTKLDPIHVNFLVPTAQYRNVTQAIADGEFNPAEAVRLILANGEEPDVAGALDFVDSTVNAGTDSIRLRATFANPDRNLLHDELVRVVLAGSSPEKVLTIPLSALQRDLVGNYVMLVDKDDKVKKQRIVAGRQSGVEIIVEEGLSEGDRVITQGVNKVREGQQVDAAEADAGAKQGDGSDSDQSDSSTAKGD